MKSALSERPLSTRRGLRTLTAAFLTTAVLVAVSACGSDGDQDSEPVDLNADPTACASSDQVPAADRADGPFQFTDGRGRNVRLDKQPTRIIADEESAAALYAAGIKPVGIWSTTPLSVSPILKCLDLDGVEAVGEKWGEVSMEKVLALKPDLFVGEYNPRFEQFGKLTSKDDSSKADRLDEIAPTVGVNLDTTSTTKTIENYQKLDTALGVNVNSEDQTKIKEDFDAAVARFKKAASEHQDVVGMGVWPLEVAYVLDPKADPDFSDYQKWGLKMFSPGTTDDGYWRKYSWETFPPDAADLMFVYHDVANSANVKLAEIGKRFPVFQQSAAVNAKQMVLWDYGANKSYPRYTKTINAFADALEKSKKVR